MNYLYTREKRILLCYLRESVHVEPIHDLYVDIQSRILHAPLISVKCISEMIRGVYE